jgi:hypothetical protein
VKIAEKHPKCNPVNSKALIASVLLCARV